MVCDRHKAPAAFFSQKEDRYVCFKCLVSSEQLLYIDKSYKLEMEEFEKIKTMTMDSIKSNIKNTTIVQKWKRDIRECLIRVRTRYVTMIDKFIYEFSQTFNNPDSQNAKIFNEEDKKLKSQVDELHDKYIEIAKIFNNIS